MIKIERIEFAGMGPFTETQDVDLTRYNSIVLLDGKSGAGKTTLVNAILYVLNICPIPSTKLQSRNSKTQMWGKLYCTQNDQKLVICRSKKEGLQISIDGQDLDGSTSFLEEKLDHIIGINRDLFKRMFYKPQKEGGFFLNLTGKQSYEFLLKIMGFDKQQDLMDKIAKDVKENTSKLSLEQEKYRNLKSRLLELETSSLSLKSNWDNIQKPILRGYQTEAEGLEDLTSTNSKLFVIEQEYKSKLDGIVMPKQIPISLKNFMEEERLAKEIERQLNLELKICRDNNELLRSSIRNNNEKIKESRRAYDKIKDIVVEIKNIKSQIQSIQDNICPTCTQHWQNESAEIKINQLNDQITIKNQEILSLKPKMVDENKINAINVDLQNSIIDIDNNPPESCTSLKLQYQQALDKVNEIKAFNLNIDKESQLQYRKEQSDYNLAISTIKAGYIESINHLTQTRRQIEQYLSEYKTATDFYNKTLKYHETQTNLVSEQLNRCNEEITTYDLKIKDLSTQIELGEQAQKVIKQFLLKTFRETLDSIGAIASKYLSYVHNTSDCSIYFEESKETKSGSVKDEITCILSKAGDVNIAIQTVSGGERTVIDLAVDLALIEIMESMFGQGCNLFIVDEPCDGLDTEAKENYLKLLNQADVNKIILLVDHSPELKEMISDVIKVDKDITSFITQ